MLYALCATVRNKIHMRQLCHAAGCCRGNRLHLDPVDVPFESLTGTGYPY